MNTLFLKSFTVLVISLLIYAFIGCGEESNPGNPPPNVNIPDIDIRQGSVYTYTYDTIDQNNNTYRINRNSRDSVMISALINNSRVSSIRSVTTGDISSIDTIIVIWEPQSGKFYHFGAFRIINPGSQPTQDLIADFSVPLGTSWNVPVNPDSLVIEGFTIKFSVSAKVAEQTSFTTTGSNQQVQCYRTEFKADVRLANPIITLGSIYFDYYIGYKSSATNPSGIVRLRLRPINLTFGSITILRQAGIDRVLSTYFIP
jgi:hypothetical protein